MKDLLPYILTAILFSVIFSITEFVPNEDLYLGYGREWKEVKMDNKIPIQSEIFCFGLPAFLITVDYLIGLISNQSFLKRGFLAVVTLISIFIINGSVFHIWGSVDHWSMYWYPRGIPATQWIFGALMILLIGFAISNMTRNLRIRTSIDNLIAEKLFRKTKI